MILLVNWALSCISYCHSSYQLSSCVTSYLSLLVLPQTVQDVDWKHVRQSAIQTTNKQLKPRSAWDLKARVVEFLHHLVPCKVWCLTVAIRHFFFTTLVWIARHQSFLNRALGNMHTDSLYSRHLCNSMNTVHGAHQIFSDFTAGCTLFRQFYLCHCQCQGWWYQMTTGKTSITNCDLSQMQTAQLLMIWLITSAKAGKD